MSKPWKMRPAGREGNGHRAGVGARNRQIERRGASCPTALRARLDKHFKGEIHILRTRGRQLPARLEKRGMPFARQFETRLQYWKPRSLANCTSPAA